LPFPPPPRPPFPARLTSYKGGGMIFLSVAPTPASQGRVRVPGQSAQGWPNHPTFPALATYATIRHANPQVRRDRIFVLTEECKCSMKTVLLTRLLTRILPLILTLTIFHQSRPRQYAPT